MGAHASEIDLVPARTRLDEVGTVVLQDQLSPMLARSRGGAHRGGGAEARPISLDVLKPSLEVTMQRVAPAGDDTFLRVEDDQPALARRSGSLDREGRHARAIEMLEQCGDGRVEELAASVGPGQVVARLGADHHVPIEVESLRDPAPRRYLPRPLLARPRRDNL